MQNRTKLFLGAVIAGGVILIGAGVGVASMGDDDKPLTGSTNDRATAAALGHVGGGTVLETEVGDGGAAYEVEIRLDGGREVEVQLDEDFGIIGSSRDDDGSSDAGEAGESD